MIWTTGLFQNQLIVRFDLFLAAALSAPASASVFHSAAGGGSFVDVVRPL